MACSRCGKMGHNIKTCKVPKKDCWKCSLCGQPDHKEHWCTREQCMRECIAEVIALDLKRMTLGYDDDDEKQ